MDPVSSGLDPTLPLETFGNTTDPTGGDSRLYNLNVFYNVSLATRDGTVRF
jgi:Amt family ammonium transporter